MSDAPESQHRLHRALVIAVIVSELTLGILAAAVLADAAARRDALARVATAQDAPLASLHRVKVQLDRLGRGSAALAAQGDANAQAVLAELQRRGVAVNPNAAPVTP